MSKYCSYGPEHVSVHIYGTRLSNQEKRIEEVEAMNALLLARDGKHPITFDDDAPSELARLAGDVLVGLSEACHVGLLAAAIAPGAQVTDQTKTGRQTPESKEPKGGNRAAAYTLRRLLLDTKDSLDGFSNRKEADWQNPVDTDPPGPKVRCWKRGCERYSRYFTDECPGCGTPATKTATTAENNVEGFGESDAHAESA